jgi:predicted dehydrogenase
MNRRHFLSTTAATLAASAASSSFAAGAGEKKMRVAVIGHTGRGNYGHGLDTMWLKIPESEIVAVADADAKGLEGAQAKLKLSKGYADYRKMLEEVKPDIVSIGPRHVDQHHEMIMAAINAGAKGIYLEKPFVRNLVEADQVVNACAKSKCKLALAHRNRYHPALPRIVQLIKDGAIGRPLEYRTRGKEDPRGGSLDLWVLGSHLLNLTNFFAGDYLACTATVLQNGKPVTKADVVDGAEGIGPLAGNEVHARFEMQSSLPVFFDSVQGAGAKTAGFGVQIIGNNGIIDLRIDEEPIAHYLEGSPFRPVTKPRAWVPISSAGIGEPEPIENLKELCGAHILAGQDLIAAIKEDRDPLCSAQEGRTTIEAISAVFESHRLGGQRVTLPLKTRQNPLTLL